MIAISAAIEAATISRRLCGAAVQTGGVGLRLIEFLRPL
jgi:hypothetical protein